MPPSSTSYRTRGHARARYSDHRGPRAAHAAHTRGYTTRARARYGDRRGRKGERKGAQVGYTTRTRGRGVLTSLALNPFARPTGTRRGTRRGTQRPRTGTRSRLALAGAHATPTRTTHARYTRNALARVLYLDQPARNPQRKQTLVRFFQIFCLEGLRHPATGATFQSSTGNRAPRDNPTETHNALHAEARHSR